MEAVMRRSIRIITWVVISAWIITMVSCSISGPDVSIEDRIDKFESDLSSNNWTSLYEHVHPDNGKRSQTKTSDYWTTYFNDGESYSFSSPSGSGNSRTVTVSSGDNWDGDDLKFKMKEHKEGPLSRSSWYIDGIKSDAGPTSPVL